MSNLTLVLLYESPHSEAAPYPVARIDDQRLLIEAGRRAIHEAEERAQELSECDDVLGHVGHADAVRLRDILRMLIPGLALESSASVM
jgi:hypothetical protein